MYRVTPIDGTCSLQQLTTQFSLNAHGCAAWPAESSFILCDDSELVLGGLHKTAHGELAVLGALLGAFLPGTFSSLPVLNPVAQDLLAAIMLRSEPVDGDAVFGDRDDVDLSWLARFVYKETDKRRLPIGE